MAKPVLHGSTNGMFYCYLPYLKKKQKKMYLVSANGSNKNNLDKKVKLNKPK